MTLVNDDPYDFGEPYEPTVGPTADPGDADTSPQRKKMIVFFLVDTSLSMRGERINAVNTAIRNSISILKDVQAGTKPCEMHMCVIEFNKEADVIHPPESVSTIVYNDLSVSGDTQFAKAFSLLNERMSPKKDMQSVSGHFAPVIILLTDGEPTDKSDNGIPRWETELEKLNKNSWFRVATKVAIAIGEEAKNPKTFKVIAEFASKDCALYAAEIDDLRTLIELVTVSASKLNASGASLGGFPGGKEGEPKDTGGEVKPPWVNDIKVVVPDVKNVVDDEYDFS